MHNHYINFNGKHVSRRWLESHPDAAQELLQQSVDSRPVCMCRPDRGIPLFVKLKSQYSVCGIYGTGHMHDINCPDYELNQDLCGLHRYSNDAISLEFDGNLQINLDLLAGSQTDLQKSVEPVSHGEQVFQKLNSLKLQGLLHLLWDCANLNKWSSDCKGKRNYSVLQKLIYGAADDLYVNRQPLKNYLYFPDVLPDNLNLECEQHLGPSDSNGFSNPEKNRQILLLGLINKTKKQNNNNYCFYLNNATVECPMLVSEDIALAFFHSIGVKQELVDWKKHAVMTLMLIEQTQEQRYEIKQIAGMRLTRQYIPIESEEEQILIEELVANKRRFVKPLIYDSRHVMSISSAFLLDAAPYPLPMEILRHQDSEFHSKQTKQRIDQYNQKQYNFWCWDNPNDSVGFPALPDEIKAYPG